MFEFSLSLAATQHEERSLNKKAVQQSLHKKISSYINKCTATHFQTLRWMQNFLSNCIQFSNRA